MATEAKKKTSARKGQAQFKAWLKLEERALFTQKAEEAGMTNVDWLRHRCIATAPRRRRKGPDVKAIHQLRGELSKLGNNVNQLTVEAKARGWSPPQQELMAMRAELHEMTGMLAAALGYDLKG